ncbi:MAG TPA: zinc-ribbon domain-containing protein [Pyrinomonadaceae bacterium]|jgi:uncharacterized Zn finger protein (UPF0148 family)
MAKTLVEKKICDSCGAEVRPGSVFCYNCGGAVAADLPEQAAGDKRNATIDRFEQPGGAPENNVFKTTKLPEKTLEKLDMSPIAKPVGKPAGDELMEKIEDSSAEKNSVQENGQLKSAANLRRKAKSFQRKTVEVVWEEPENAPNKWFPIVAIVLILFVAAIFYLAMYLK